MPEKYYRLNEYRMPSDGEWVSVYLSLDEKGKLKIIKNHRRTMNSKLEEISEEEKESALKESRDG